MPGPLHDGLHAGRPAAVHQLAQRDDLHQLRPVRGVPHAPGAHAVAEAQREVVFRGDLQQVVELAVEGVILAVVQHPCDGKGAAPADHVHEPGVAAQGFERSVVDAAVHGREVHAVLRVLPQRVEHVVGRHVDDGGPFSGRMVDGHGAHGDSQFAHELFPYGVDLPACGEVHHRVGPVFHCYPGFLRLFGRIIVVLRGAHVRVHLGGHELTDGAAGDVAGDVTGDRHPARGDEAAQPVCVHALALRHVPDPGSKPFPGIAYQHDGST
ncbi:MAG: hypothetical protein A4E28_01772 [Methanocella sp. PtaU1.Bin125]|nr:MAG: hypothetical protein A4E28_01772 [Methanocella sp. PtaU1.Bin125]